MVDIKFLKKLEALLKRSDDENNKNKYEPAIRDYAQRAAVILSDNKTVFFPNYTDHGADHVNSVLQSMVKLVPKKVWEDKLLTAADAVVMIGAAILHDFAMHLSVKGFLELVNRDTRFKPLPWFDTDHQGYSADRPWPELWDDYQREAKKFSDRALGKIIGKKEAQSWKFDGLSDKPGSWEANDYLVIGEFVRRHHARLAHEIAIYGFPGVEVGIGKNKFPALGLDSEEHQLESLADLIGLTARSHWMNLRVCKSYIDSHDEYKDTPSPMDVAILYPMALLRVADYLQIEQKRAPFILLQLKNPQSPISIEEWKKHHAVRHLGNSSDLYGIKVTIEKKVSLKTFLQLEELLNDLQSEMDHSTAALDEVYGRIDGLKYLTLAKRRVHSNLFDPNFRNKLPYVPEKTGFSADPNILSLLVEPLYGQEPSVGVRELIQNSVDAVLERVAWEKKHGKVDGVPELEEGADVLVDFIQKKDEKWILRVQDRGIGMMADTIQNFFLRAGASFRDSKKWIEEFTDDEGHVEIARSGRFGIGAYAIFLLGVKFCQGS